MPVTVACNLPLGLTVRHEGKAINLNGSNADMNPLEPGRNGVGGDTSNTINGYGLTTLGDDDAATFNAWSDAVTYRVKDDKPSKDAGVLEEPFMPLQNGSIRTFKNDAEARKELRGTPTDTGMGGIDGDAEIKSAAAGTKLVDTGTQKGN